MALGVCADARCPFFQNALKYKNGTYHILHENVDCPSIEFDTYMEMKQYILLHCVEYRWCSYYQTHMKQQYPDYYQT